MTQEPPNTPTPPIPSSIDGKYRVLREVSRNGQLTDYEVEEGNESRLLGWYTVNTSKERQLFQAYRTTLRILQPDNLLDVVIRPGAYYSLWKMPTGNTLSAFSEQATKQQISIDAVHTLAAAMAEEGYALDDGEIRFNSAGQPSLTYLRPTAARTPEEIARLNEPVLLALGKGKIRPRSLPKSPRRSGGWMAVVPGILLWLGAGYLGAKATQIYLNPPVGTVANVVGKNARAAAKLLTQNGFEVDYSYGESTSLEVGAVIRQDPSGGGSLPLGRHVMLTVNNPAPLNVPKLEDLTIEQTRAPLKENALQLSKVFKVDGSLTGTPEGRIIAQIPPAGSSIQRGQPVLVLVSSGVRKKQTWIPDLSGLTYEQAREHARAAGLVVTNVKTEASDRLENTVLRQEPKPFVRVDLGSAVKLVVAAARFTPPAEEVSPVPIPPPYIPPETDDSGLPIEVDPNLERDVNFVYTFDPTLPAGNYTVSVRDSNGEREVMPATPADTLAGQEARATLRVRGNAVFIIRLNGAEFVRVNPQ